MAGKMPAAEWQQLRWMEECCRHLHENLVQWLALLQLEPELQPAQACDANQLLESAWNSVRAADPGRRLVSQIPGGLQVEGVRAWLEFVFVNLLKAAEARFSYATDKALQVRAWQSGHRVVFSIEPARADAIDQRLSSAPAAAWDTGSLRPVEYLLMKLGGELECDGINGHCTAVVFSLPRAH